MCTTQDMELHLLQEGLNPSASCDEKLCLLWNLLMSSEETERSLKQQIHDLHKQHNTEIEKVQQYVSDIKSLTKTRDSVALHLEQENQTLHVTLDEIHLQQEAQRSEIAEMLLQEGLADIIPISLSEQVAYLLAERASLLEKIHTQTDMDQKSSGHPDGCKESVTQEFGSNVAKVAPHQVQSPWKKLLGLRKASQSKNKPMPGTDPQYSEDSRPKGRTIQELERDVEEASARLSMAHKEIRRLTDELESAQLTQKAYEPELQEAQLEVEHLRQEVEKLKRCELAELRKTKERNKSLEEELCHMRETKRLQMECIQLQEHENTDSTANLPKDQKPQEEDIHKRCLEEMQERLNMLRDLTHVTLKLQVEVETEAGLRMRVEEECEEHKRKRTEAEQLALNFQKLCEKQAEDYRSTVSNLQMEIRNLVIKSQKLEEQKVERHCEGHLKQIASLEKEVCRLTSVLRDEQENTRQQSTAMQEQIDQIQSRDVQHQRDAEGQKRLSEELRDTQNILSSTKHELLLQMKNTGQFQKTITDLEQEQLKLQINITDLENRLTNSQQETEALRTELQLALVSIDTQKSKYNDKQIHYKNKLSRAKSLYLRETGWREEKIKDLEKEIYIVKKQKQKMTDMMNMAAAENEALLQNKTNLLSQLHDLEETRKNASDTVSSLQMRIHLLEEENVHLQQTAAQMIAHAECLTLLSETDCSDVTAESRVIEGQDQTTLPT